MQAVAEVIVGEGLRLHIEVAETLAGADPQITLQVGLDAHDGVIGQAVSRGVVAPHSAEELQAAQTASGASPEQAARLVQVERVHGIGQGAVGVVGEVGIVGESASGRVQQLDAAAGRGNPDTPGQVHRQVIDGALG